MFDHLKKAQEGIKEWIREELPSPRPSRKWWANQVKQLRKDHPGWDSYTISKEVKKRWYSLPKHQQKEIK